MAKNGKLIVPFFLLTLNVVTSSRLARLNEALVQQDFSAGLRVQHHGQKPLLARLSGRCPG